MEVTIEMAGEQWSRLNPYKSPLSLASPLDIVLLRSTVDMGKDLGSEKGQFGPIYQDMLGQTDVPVNQK